MNVIALRRKAIVMFRLGRRTKDVAFDLKVPRSVVSLWRAAWRPHWNEPATEKIEPEDGRTFRDTTPDPTPEEYATRMAEVHAARTVGDWAFHWEGKRRDGGILVIPCQEVRSV